MALNGVVHFEICGPDSKALIDFYGSLFGWNIDPNNPMNYPVVFKMAGGIGGGLPQSPDGGHFVTVYISCGDDVAGKLADVAANGAIVVMDTSPIEGGPTIALFNDPAGNLVGLVNGDPTEIPADDGTGDPINWFEIGGKDGKALSQWYADRFGWNIVTSPEMEYYMADAVGGGSPGAIYPAEGPVICVYATVKDIEATLAKANSLGGSTVMEPMEVPGGPKVAQLADPAGNVIGLSLEGSM